MMLSMSPSRSQLSSGASSSTPAGVRRPRQRRTRRYHERSRQLLREGHDTLAAGAARVPYSCLSRTTSMSRRPEQLEGRSPHIKGNALIPQVGGGYIEQIAARTTRSPVKHDR